MRSRLAILGRSSVRPTRHGLALGAIALACLLLFSGVAGTAEARAAVVVVLAIGLWASGGLPEWLTALVFLTLCIVAGVAPPAVTLSGFASSAVWLTIAGIVIGAAIRHTGLGDRLAGLVAPLVAGAFPRVIIGVVLFGLAMTVVMPSAMGRVVLMLPILRALAERLGYPETSRGALGILLAGVLGTFLPAFTVLPANVPNTVFVGTVEALLGTAPSYGAYLLLHFPVLGALKVGLLMVVLILLYRDTPARDQGAPAAADKNDDDTRLTGPGRHLAAVLLVAVVLWATDVWHGLGAAWVGLLVAVWCLFPGTGLLKPRPLQSMGFEPVFYVAGIVGMGVIVDHSGLGAWLSDAVLAVVPLAPDASARTFGVLSVLSTLVGMVATQPSVPPVMTPLVPPVAAATGWTLEAVAMTQVIGFSTVLLPYQAPPLIVAMQLGGLPAREMARMCLITAGLTIVMLWPIDYVWWRFLGLVP
ncbi:SLC13 family permease [Roseospira visakhapatnamensis]|uniref:Di/tricarboxylate transporter n=1 Tax=Roseospira visakhapatnamensis TaxID=390880 RepID=A0A7W6RER6_9PROT|nr:SLC13 family permease [Roseospira visakhapatnamensis]MBB4266699.1 di/tricarboxylate transporter [Roseospira visakhapatnamensis]